MHHRLASNPVDVILSYTKIEVIILSLSFIR